MSRAAHGRIYSFFTALRAPLFIHNYTNIHPLPSQQPVQALTGNIRKMQSLDEVPASILK